MPRNPRALLAGAAVLAIAGATARAQAAPGISRAALEQAPLTELHRVGVVVVGAPVPEAVAARGFVAASLAAVGREAVPLPAAAEQPRGQALLSACAAHDLDAVALVRISTDAPGWRVNVDIHDPEGEAIPLATGMHQDDVYTGGGSLLPVFATFCFSMTAADVAAYAASHPATAEPAVADAAETRDERPHLWVTRKYAMFGPARIADAEFFRLVGRPDLYRRNRAGVHVLRGLGYTSLGMGLTALVLAAAGAGFERGECEGSSPFGILIGEVKTCGTSASTWFTLPLALSALGGALLIGAAALSSDGPSLETRKELARAYNARVAVSAAPSLNGGGVMTINGRF